MDRETGMYYYGARYYDPRISIFVSVDPLAEQTMEPYLYTGNNPIMFTDPTGMSKDGIDTVYENENTGEKVEVKDGIDRTLKVDDKDFQKAKEFSELGEIDRQNKNWDYDKFAEYSQFYSDQRYGSTFKEKLSSLGSNLANNFFGQELKDPYMEIAVIEDYGLLSGGAGAAKNIPKLIKAANGLKVNGFVKHALNRAIERGVNPKSILDALKKPLKIGENIIDKLGRQSQRFIGKKAEVVVNPQTGKVISVNPTSTKKADKLIKKGQ